MFLIRSEFDRIYASCSLQQKNTYSKIYYDSQHVVKRGEADWILPDICYLLQCKHKNILPLIHYTLYYENDTIYGAFSSLKASEIKYNKNVDKLANTLVSVVNYLQNQGLCHCDLKPENIVTLNGEYKVIDLGLARPYFPKNGEYYFQNKAYTLQYRDYQFYGDINPISCEIFSIGKTLNKVSKKVSNSHLKHFIEQCVKDPQERPTLKNLFQHTLITSKFKSFRNRKVNIPELLISRVTWYKTILKILYLMDDICVTMEEMFLALYNLRRCASILTKENSFTIASAIVYIGTLVLKSPCIFENKYITKDMLTVIPKILETLSEGFVVRTYWHSCENVNDLARSFTELLHHNSILLESFDYGFNSTISDVDKFFKIIKFDEIKNYKDLDLRVEKGFTSIYTSCFGSLSRVQTEYEMILNLNANYEKFLRLKFRNPSDVGFYYKFSWFILQNKNISNAVIFRILGIEDWIYLKRYYWVIEKERLNALLSLSRKRLSILSKNHNLLTCDERILQ